MDQKFKVVKFINISDYELILLILISLLFYQIVNSVLKG